MSKVLWKFQEMQYSCRIQIWVYVLKCVDLWPSKSTLSEICKGIRWLSDFLGKIPDHTLHCELCRICTWSHLCYLITYMEESMDTRTAKVETISTSLIVKILKLLYKLDEARMGLFKMGSNNWPICNDSDTTHKFTKVFPMLVRENSTKQARS